VFSHLDQILRGEADFFAVHANDDAGVGLDGKVCCRSGGPQHGRTQLARRQNPVAKTTNEQGLGCLRHPQVHWHTTRVFPFAPDLYYYKGVRFYFRWNGASAGHIAIKDLIPAEQ